MAAADKTTKAAEGQVTEVADHDRVVAFSVAKDGTLDQYKPEIIGDKEAALDATKEQFRQIAVAAVDAEKRAELGLAGTEEPEQTQDASIAKLQKAHQAAEDAAEKKAESLVNALHKGE